ncbi:MAG: hypothetical protein LC623_06635 [Halobacteriales archaeon]|nr:hypothetical protein [Halobacteriales archaeon]
MLARPLAAALLLASLALAGCVGREPATTTSAQAATGRAQPHGLLPPVLHVGDWWNYTAPGGDLSYVVAADGGADYTMDTDNAGLAFFDALSDVSTLGPVRKSDLAGSQGDARVEFFKWPLTDGRNWTTTWDGLPVAISAKVDGEVAQMTARRQNGTVFATYAYSNRTRWFTELDFKDDRGDSAFGLKLQAAGTGFPGKLLRYAVTPVAAGAPAPAPRVGYNGGFTVPAGATDVYLAFSTACSPGVFFLFMGPLTQDAQSQGTLQYGPCDGPHATTVPVSATGGDWGIAFECDSPTNCTASYQVVVRTLTTFEAGQAP